MKSQVMPMPHHKYIRIIAKVQRLATICLNLTLENRHKDNEKLIIKRFMMTNTTKVGNQLPEEAKMMGTWTSVLCHPLVCKIEDDVFVQVSLDCCKSPGNKDGININIDTHDASHLPVKKVWFFASTISPSQNVTTYGQSQCMRMDS